MAIVRGVIEGRRAKPSTMDRPRDVASSVGRKRGPLTHLRISA
jgi:hypothetical protein